MIIKLWSGKSPLWRLLLPFSWIYGLVSNTIRICYKMNWKRSWHAKVPVVIVGNITAGGSGKTPFVIWLVEQLQQRGIRVGVVSRGYGGKAARYPLLLNKNTTISESGDEPMLIYKRTGVPIAVDPDRNKAVQALLCDNSLQMIITDDGLQHYALGRDVEIVIVDGIRRFGNGWWIPAGPMRERASRLQSVDAVIVNGGIAQNEEIPMQLRPGLAVNMLTGERCEVSHLNNLVAIAGIGYPPHFFSTLAQCGAKLSHCISLSDHQALSAEKVNTFTRSGQMLIMTEKDAVKYHKFAQKNWWYLPVYAEINDEKSEHLIQRIISIASKARTRNRLN